MSSNSMHESTANRLANLIVVGDRVLIHPKSGTDRTKSGLFLPPGVEEKEQIRSGYVMKVGPGYPIPVPTDDALEPWKEADEKIKYVPLQAKVGDLAIFLQNSAYEVEFYGEKYLIVPQNSILLLERDEELLD